MKFRKHLLTLTLLVLIAFSGGCAKQYSMKESDPVKVFQTRNESALNSSEPSQQTQQMLRLLFLEKDYNKKPLKVIGQLQDKVHETNDPKLRVAIAELSLLQGRKHFKNDIDTSILMYLAAAEQAWDYLFYQEKRVESYSPLAPSYRFMTDIYNRAVARLVENRSKKTNPWEDETDIVLGHISYNLHIKKDHPHLWNPELFDELVPTSQIVIGGIRNEYFSHGLGTPLAGIVYAPNDNPGFGKYPPEDEASYPVTVVLTFEPTQHTDGTRQRDISLAFYDTLITDSIEIGGREIPLEADFTTPLGMLMTKVQAPDLGFAAMKRSDIYLKQTGITMLEPYREDKIPVVMVHGLMSSPQTWVHIFNDLRGDPEIRDRYQFWIFLYPTGLPIIYSASLLRNDLLAIQQEYDADKNNPNFNEMVIVAHSLGGILSHMLNQDSGDAYWDELFTLPFDEIPLSETNKKFVKPIMFFDRPEFIKRIVFIATPHRGSRVADSIFGKIGAGMTTQPQEVVHLGSDIDSLDQADLTFNAKTFRSRIPNSIAQLSPSSDILKTMNSVPMDSKIPYHSIIATKNKHMGPGGFDGLVAYESAHLDGAESEIVIKSEHFVHNHPLAIKEVKRILLKHTDMEKIKQPVRLTTGVK